MRFNYELNFTTIPELVTALVVFWGQFAEGNLTDYAANTAI